MEHMRLSPSQIYKKPSDNHAKPFCNCYTHENDGRRFFSQKVKCNCGENTCKILEWNWDEMAKLPETIIDANNILFHPIYSQGTSVIKGNTKLQCNAIHYWEIKILTCLSGTDLMIGIGTDQVNLLSHQYRFASFLGLDSQSWGYSFRGLVQNCGRLKYYGKRYILGCIIGVYLDLFKGHLEFYVNRRPQGIAYRNIPHDGSTILYPMACSTPAKSSIKLLNATSFQECLQFRCMKIISKYPKLIKQVNEMPGLKYLSNDLWFLQCQEQYEYCEFERNNLLLEDEAIINDIKMKQYKQLKDDDDPNDSITSLDDIYSNMYNIKHAKTDFSSSDDDLEIPLLI